MPGTTITGMPARRSDVELLAAAPEDERIAAFQARDALAAAGVLEQQRMNALLRDAVATGFLADEYALRRRAARARARPRSPAGRTAPRRSAAAAAVRAASADPDRRDRRRSGTPRRAIAARPRRPRASSASSSRSASCVLPANTLLAMLPANSRSQNRRRRSISGSARCTRSRAAPASRASSPMRSGSIASSCARTRRASVGDWPAGADRDDQRRAIDDGRHDGR